MLGTLHFHSEHLLCMLSRKTRYVRLTIITPTQAVLDLICTILILMVVLVEQRINCFAPFT